MIILTTIIIVGCYFEARFIRSSFNWLINSIESLQIVITENKEKIDSEEIIKKSYSLQQNWHKKVGTLKCLVWHTGIKDIEVALARIAVYVEENDFTEAYAETASLIDYVAHYLDDFRVSTENIF